MAKEEKKPNPEKSGSNRILRTLRKIRREIPRRIRNFGTRLDPTAVFILGNYKTGSTAIAALLAIGTGQSITSDIFYRTTKSVKMKLLQKELSMDWYVHHFRHLFSKKIIKEPDLIFYVDQIEVLFPQCRFAFLLRDPRDNIRSILNFLKLPGNLNDLSARQLEALPGSIWKLAMEGTLFGTQGDNYIATQALRWKRIVEIYEHYADRMILLKYESFLQDKVGAIHKLAEQLGLRITADITPHTGKQYQPKGDHSLSWLEFYGKDNLSIIESICKNKMESYGYHIPKEIL